MKRLLISTCLTLALAAPVFAQPAPPPPNGPPAPVVDDGSVPMDVLIEHAAATGQDPSRLILRCAGPPPMMPKPVAASEKPGADPFKKDTPATPAG